MKRVAVLVMLLLFVLATANTSEARGGRLFRNLRNSRISQPQTKPAEKPVESVEEVVEEVVEPEEVSVLQAQPPLTPQERPSFSLLAIPFGSEAQRSQIAEISRETPGKAVQFSLVSVNLDPAQSTTVSSILFPSSAVGYFSSTAIFP